MHQISLALVALLLFLIPTDSRAEVTLKVSSEAAQFSPGTWAGDSGRGGDLFRTTWNNGAWCEWRWTTPSDHPAATLQISNQTEKSTIAYFLDGALVDKVPVPATGGVVISGLIKAGPHTLRVYTASSDQKDRWQGANAFKISGLTVDDGATPQAPAPELPWVLVLGDSITEGIGTGSSLNDYAFLVAQGLLAHGYETAVSACGSSGWIEPGDGKGDVPAYYAVKDGVYSDALSRWNKIDANTSLLDTNGHLSGQGKIGQEPAAILINYMVNEALRGADLKTAQASTLGAIKALRQAAPQAWILVAVPPGLPDTKVYPHGGPYVTALKDAVADYLHDNPADDHTRLVDLGPDVSHTLASRPYGGGVHPNAAGHAYIAPRLLEAVLRYLH